MEIPAGGLAEEVLRLLRVQRHDYLNVFQVVMGFLQLGKPDRALEFIRQAIEDSEKGAGVTRLAYPRLALWILLQAAAERRRGKPVNVSVQTDLQQCGLEEERLLELLRSVWPQASQATRGLSFRLLEEGDRYCAGFFPAEPEGGAVPAPAGWEPAPDAWVMREDTGFWLCFPRRPPQDG